MKTQANGSNIFKVLSDDSKLKIVEFLLKKQNGSTCSDISSFIGRDISTTFRHVESLRKARIITTEKKSKFLICHLNNKEKIREFFDLSEKVAKGG